jgi:demethylmacrocin O-methyltransferase
MNQRRNLNDLAVKWGSDKGSVSLRRPESTPESMSRGHDYAPFYERLLEGRGVRCVFEIGVLFGASLRMWAEHFPLAQVIGIDYNPECIVNEGRIRSFVCNQADEAALRALATDLALSFDLVVDDGSHIPEHQIISALTLMPFVAEGGVYVIEDTYKSELGRVVGSLPWPTEIVEFSSPCPESRLIVIEKR